MVTENANEDLKFEQKICLVLQIVK
jgi:hypothetical protein